MARFSVQPTRASQILCTMDFSQSPPCTYKGGWKKTKARTESKVYKQKVFDTAIEKKHNLIIPSPCASNMPGCLQRVMALKKAGYTNHVVVIYARDNLVTERGRSRADRDGKMFVSVVKEAVAAFAPVMSVADGQWTLMDNTGRAVRGESGQCLNIDVSDQEAEEVKFELDMREAVEKMYDVGPPPEEGATSKVAAGKYDS